MRKVFAPQSIPDPRPRYSQGILAEGKRLLFIAGQTAVDADNNVVGKGDAGAQAEPRQQPVRLRASRTRVAFQVSAEHRQTRFR